MVNPIVHFEIIGQDAAKLRQYYSKLFDWQADMDAPVAPEVSEAGNYGFIDKIASPDDSGIPGGIGGGRDFDHHAVFYVGVDDVGAALRAAERLGGKQVMGGLLSGPTAERWLATSLIPKAT